ncbi:phage major capsid protein [Companilactobacillus muriivasis]|uniref:phage major capsid protein n=1 Tax=Companilactobacillus muriivasis TaxID=3081444 RepID=UPI0030C74EA2
MAVTFDPDEVTMQDAKTGEVPANLTDEIITSVKTGSAIMQMAKAVPMTKPKERFTFMTGVGAYWVEEGQKIKTSKPTFLEAWIEAHKMGVIIPTTKENLSYTVTNFFELMKAEIAEAFAKKFDQSVLFGTDSPFPQSVLGSAALTKQVTNETKNKYDDISGALAFLEENDLDANAIAAPRSQKVKYRATKDGNGNPIFNDAHGSSTADLLGLPIGWASRGSWDKTQATEILADWDKVRYGILGGIKYEILTEATLSINGEDGQPINLAERDMAAIKATFTPAFMVFQDEAVSAIVPSGATPKENKQKARQQVVKKSKSEEVSSNTPDVDAGTGTAK